MASYFYSFSSISKQLNPFVVRLVKAAISPEFALLLGLLVCSPPVAGTAAAVEPGKSLDPTIIHDADEVVAFLIEEQIAARESDTVDVDKDPYVRAALGAPADSGYIIAPFTRRQARGVVEVATSFTSPSEKTQINLKIIFPAAGKEAEAEVGALQQIRELEIRAKASPVHQPAAPLGSESAYSSSASGSELIVNLGHRSYLSLSSAGQVRREVLIGLAGKIPLEQIRASSAR